MKKLSLLMLIVFFSFSLLSASTGEVIKSQGYPFYCLLITLIIMLVMDLLNMVEKWNISTPTGKERIPGYFVFFCFCLTMLFGLDLNYSLVPSFIAILTNVLFFLSVMMIAWGAFAYEKKWRRVLRMTLYALTLLVLLTWFFIG
jgi:hypothetical protein